MSRFDNWFDIILGVVWVVCGILLCIGNRLAILGIIWLIAGILFLIRGISEEQKLKPKSKPDTIKEREGININCFNPKNLDKIHFRF